MTPIVYAELHRLAHRYMRRERAGNSLQTTALVHEAYVRLVDYKRMQWQDRAHFFAVSAQLMRRILVERARRRHRRDDAGLHMPLDEATIASGNRPADLVALDDALNALEQMEPRKVRVIEMRFFAGLDPDETAEVLKISAVTVRRDLRTAKAWLYRELTGAADHESRTMEADR